MKSIHYAGGEFITGDAIAEAVVHYGEALARRESSAAVDIPVRSADGRIEDASILLGPASQVVALPEHSGFDELIDEGVVERLNRAAMLLADPRPVAEGVDEPGRIQYDDLDLA